MPDVGPLEKQYVFRVTESLLQPLDWLRGGYPHIHACTYNRTYDKECMWKLRTACGSLG